MGKIEWKIVEGALVIRQKDWCGQQVWTRANADDAASCIKEEREACAKVAEDYGGYQDEGAEIAAAIRARSEREG